MIFKKMKTPTKQRHTSLSSQPVSNNENVCVVAYIVPGPLIASFQFLTSGKQSALNRFLVPGLLDAGLDRLGSASLCRGLVPDPDLLVPGHLRWYEASRD